jgi:hypothetical protein
MRCYLITSRRATGIDTAGKAPAALLLGDACNIVVGPDRLIWHAGWRSRDPRLFGDRRVLDARCLARDLEARVRTGAPGLMWGGRGKSGVLPAVQALCA